MTAATIVALLQCNCASTATRVGDLDWMSGQWSKRSGGALYEEHWSVPASGSMVGTSQFVRGSTVSREFLLLAEDDGGVVYRAWPAGQAPASFRLVRLDDRKVTFENPAHDFPQRIEYWRVDDVLNAKISGTRDGKPMSVEFSWTRHDPASIATKVASKKVTGIGGIFFKSTDPAKLRQWYAEHLGLVTNEYGSLFEFRSTDDPAAKGYLQWSPFSQTTKYFAPSDKPFMINYRVEDLAGLLDKLRSAGVTIVDAIDKQEYGNFVHIMDPEGNKIELWEPVDTVFTRLYEGKTTH